MSATPKILGARATLLLLRLARVFLPVALRAGMG
jgi:hypothetical protein